MDKLELIIRDKQIELRDLQADLNEALTGVESLDFKTAARLEPLIAAITDEIERLEKLRLVRPASIGFQSYFSRLLTDDSCSVMELWTHFKNYRTDVTIRLLEIRKLKGRNISCKLRLIEPADSHLYLAWTTSELQHIGWRTLGSSRSFYYKTMMRSPDQFDAFCQMLSVTLLEPLGSLWKYGQQYYRYR